ncbi:MAG: TIGR02757 family protein [Bacteroidetes bacterium]|nr:TIGR02757 family protein [Bacteroidota bacterium]
MLLKQKLEYHYKAFDKTKIEPDPLQFPHKYTDKKDIETIAFIASVFAYGNVKQIINTLNKVVNLMNNKPYEFIINHNIKACSNSLKGLKHRFYTEKDIAGLFHVMNLVYNEFASLKNLFLSGFNVNDANIKGGISTFSNYFNHLYRNRFGKESRGVKFMFPIPEKGSACKRMNLFLRWMIRKDELDFGLWNEIPASKLIIPVDTHVASICAELKLTTRKNVSWKMAEEITENLKKFDPDDPVKYDFAICHIGMRKLKF